MFNLEAILIDHANHVQTWLLLLVIVSCPRVLSKRAARLMNGVVSLASMPSASLCDMP